MSSHSGILAVKENQDEVVRQLLLGIPEGASSIQLRTAQLVTVTRTTLEIFNDSGHLDWLSPRDVVAGKSVRKLREEMFQPSVGTWFGATVNVDAGGAATFNYDYDDEPEWDAPVDPIVYVKDQEKFPRDEVNQPEWLKERLAEGRARIAKNSQ